MKHLLFAPAIALLAAMALVGCSDDNGGTDPRIPATSVVVDVTEQELHVGETLQLTATPMPANTTDRVQWTSDEPATATVSETGLVTAVALGSTSVKAVCGEVSATCVIRVVEPDPSELYDIISFEEEEGMTDIGGQRVTLGDIEVVGGFAAGVHSNVFWAKPYAEYGDPDGIMGLTIDLPLFTSDGNVWFGSYYCDCTGWGSQMDTWGGFVLSRNCNTSASSFDYADQFSVYAQSGANGSKTFAAAYCNGMMGVTIPLRPLCLRRLRARWLISTWPPRRCSTPITSMTLRPWPTGRTATGSPDGSRMNLSVRWMWNLSGTARWPKAGSRLISRRLARWTS